MPNRRLQIRNVAPSEIEAARLLLAASGWEHRVSDPVQFRELLSRSQVALVAVENGQVIGFIRALSDGVTNGYISMLVVAGTYGSPDLGKAAIAAAGKDGLVLQTPGLISVIMGKSSGMIMFLLAIAAFPSACFSSFIAANSFKTTLRNVNPFVSVGIGTAVSIVLAITGLAGKAIIVFQIIGASFGPICGAMLVDYLLNGMKWSGPRAGFNPAGWISWLLGLIVGILPILHDKVSASIPSVPAAPVAAFVVGAVVYGLLAKMGMQSALLPVSGKLAEATSLPKTT